MTDVGVLRGSEFVDLEALTLRASRASSALESLGVGRGSTVGLLFRNDHAFFEASFAAANLGAAPVPINWHGTPDEVAYIAADAKMSVLVGHADLLHAVVSVLPPEVRVVGVETPQDIASTYGLTETSLPDGIPEWAAWRDEFPPWATAAVANPLSMIYTSGTTGRPKGVRRLPDSLDASRSDAFMADVNRVFGFHAGMRTVITGPMYHSAPNFYALTAARVGGFVVLQTRFDAEELLALVERHRITSLHMVPTMFVRLLRLPEEVRSRYDLSSLRHVAHAAAPCPPDIKRAMIDWFGPIIYEYYGGTETGPVVGCDSREWLDHPGTVGGPLKTCTVRIYGEDGRQLPAFEPGEVFMRAGGFFDFTYQGNNDARAEIERDGLFTCGDVGYLDDDGFLHLCDRKRDMIISGGVNIYPAEIEACLLTHPSIRDCAVFGVPDAEYGEAVAAAVELDGGKTLTDDEIRVYVRTQLAGFKTPKIVEFHENLPREDSGKVLKRKLRAPHWESTGRSI